ncbi:MAG: tRNA-binding protein [Firmicutes bacterium]|nr:tRNA-binding protein [Bacillota bacterium]
MATIDDFAALDIRVGEIRAARVHPSAKKPAYQLEIDFGELGVKHSSAQLTALYQVAELIGRQVVAVVNFPPRRIGGFVSEVLVLGALGADGEVVLLAPDRSVTCGAKIG